MSEMEPVPGPAGTPPPDPAADAAPVPTPAEPAPSPAEPASAAQAAEAAATEVTATAPPPEPVAAPVAPVPVAPAASPAGAAGRPRGLLRWGVALLALAAVIGVVSVAFAVLAGSTSSSAIAGWMPSTTVGYVEVRTDLPGDQRAKVGAILAKFPGFADQSSLDAKIDEALNRMLQGSGVSWTTDIKPWIGGDVGLAVTSAALQAGAAAAGSGTPPAAIPDDGAVAMVEVKDAAAATAWLGKQLGGTGTTQTYAGGQITLVSGPQGSTMAYATRGTVLILGPEKTVKAALDTGGKSSVASSGSFTAAQKSAPSSYIAFAYLDTKAFVDASMAAASGSSPSVPKACLDQLTGSVPAWMSGTMAAGDDALVLQATASAATGGSSTVKASASAIASHLPAGTIAAVEVRQLGTQIVDGVAALKKALACDPSTASAIDQLDQALSAVGGISSLVGWAGDTAVAAGLQGSTVGGGLASVVTDEAAASRTLDQVKALLTIGGSSAGISVGQESYGSGTLLVITVPSSIVGGDIPKLGVTVQGGILALGTVDWVKQVVDTTASASLASADAYKRAISAAGGDGVSDVYVDLAGLRGAAEAMMPPAARAKYETDVKPFITPFEAFASVVPAPGGTTVSRAVVTFTK